jgi:hypothetical protein
MIYQTESKAPIFSRQTEKIERVGNITRENKEIDYNESLYFQNKYDKVYDRVISIMRQHPETRKYDYQLLLIYWAKMGMIKIIVPLSNLNKITPPESITRQKRKAIENAKAGDEYLRWLLKDESNLNIRSDHEELYHGYYQDKNNSKTAEVIK